MSFLLLRAVTRKNKESKPLVGPTWMQVDHGGIVRWKGFIVDMILEKKNHLNQIITAIDLGA